jgi:hypothetical protein
VSDHAVHQLIRLPCTIRHSDPGAMDEFGDHPVTVVTETTERCYLTQTRRAEENEVEVERWQLYFLPYVLIDANDVVVVSGMEFEMFGNPWTVTDPVTGFPTHIEATAVRRR